MKAFTNIKDVDLKILSELDDRDLLNVCVIRNRYVEKLCNDENFWRARLVKNYPDLLEYKNNTNKLYYLQILVDIERFKNKWEIFDYIAIGKRTIYYRKNLIDPIGGVKIGRDWLPWNEAPNWFKINLLASDLGKNLTISIKNKLFNIIDEKKITPMQLILKTSRYLKSYEFIVGFKKGINSISPIIKKFLF